jgi:ribosomal protein S27E
MDRGVTCTSCGASTPLPANLLVPTFTCGFCKAELQTAAYAGQQVVSADALMAHIRAQVESPSTAAGQAPRFDGQSDQTRPSACVRCRAPVAVPLDLTVRRLRCGSCGHDQAVNEHLSDGDRFRMDMARQIAGNQALKALKAEGVPCPKCGGKNHVPDDGSVQVPCRFCGAVILLADHVDATAVARARLKQGVYGLREDMLRAKQKQDRMALLLGVGIVLVMGAILGLSALFSMLHGR